jgi:hypothetical protein
MKKYVIAVVALAVAGSAAWLLAQAGRPLSPPGEASISIAGKNISIQYSRPSIRGRKIMGELVPYGQVWRTGANAATKLTTDADLEIGGLKVPKGSYSLYTLPGAAEWKLIVNKVADQSGTDYDQAQDLGRVDMQVSKAPQPLEQMTISLDKSGARGGVLRIAWENTIASVPFKVLP